MAASVVTFNVQVGSTGYAVAREVADRLGYRYYDWQITSQAGISEPDAGDADDGDFADRLMRRLLTATYLEAELPPGMIAPSPTLQIEALSVLSMAEKRRRVEEVVRLLSRSERAVIVGHGSQVVLRYEPHVFKVLVTSSVDNRAATLAEQQCTSLLDARSVVLDIDALRSRFFRESYGIDWLLSSLYDLVINADNLCVDLCAEMVVAAARHPAWQSRPEEGDRAFTHLLGSQPRHRFRRLERAG
jgi:cytidylate kinase